MNDVTIARGRWLVTGGGPDDPTFSNAAVAMADGRIREIGDWAEIRARYPGAPTIGSDRQAIMPGMINGHHHSHGVSGLQQGIEDQLLEPWILSLRRARATDPYLDTLISAARLLRTGVTAVVDVHSGRGPVQDYAAAMGRALSAYAESGIRVAFAAGVRDQSYLVAGGDDEFLAGLPAEVRPFAEQELPVPGAMTHDEYFATIDRYWETYRDHDRVDVWFGPPGPQWVSDGFWRRIAEQAEVYDTGIQTHVAESIYEKLHGPRDYGMPTVPHLRELGVLGPRFSIAHGVWLTESEIAVLAETGTTISHNPSSNLRLRAGIAPLNALLESGATLALGMDGTTLDDDEDMFAEMRLALRLNRTPQLGTAAPSPARILEMATAGGARLLRKDAELGRLAPGYAADMVLIDLERVTWPWVAPEVDPRDILLLRAKAGDVDTVLIGGEIVLRDGRPTRFDLAEAGRSLADKLAKTPHPAEEAARIAALTPHVEAYYGGWEMPDLDPFVRYNSKS